MRDSLAYEVEVTARLEGTEDSDEGRRSFIERREPVFKGR